MIPGDCLFVAILNGAIHTLPDDDKTEWLQKHTF